MDRDTAEAVLLLGCLQRKIWAELDSERVHRNAAGAVKDYTTAGSAIISSAVQHLASRGLKEK